MNRKTIAVLAIGLCTGYVLAVVFRSNLGSETQTAKKVGHSPLVAVQDPNYGRENAVLQTQPSTSLGQVEVLQPPADVAKRRVVTREEADALRLTVQKSNYVRALQKENDQLIAAGFTKERIQLIRDRVNQLERDRRKADAERRLNGLPALSDLDYSLDNSDLDLRNEIGVDEYEKYRKATGRRLSVPVKSILPGSIAESVGLKPGDEIIRFDNKRTYSMGQITKLSGKEVDPSQRLVLEVQRNGQPLRFDVPAGVLGIVAPIALPSQVKLFELGLQADGIDPSGIEVPGL